MVSYFGVFVQRLMGKNPFAPEQPKKFAYKTPPPVKQKEYVKPKPALKNSGLKLSYNDFNPMTLITTVVTGIIALFIFSTVGGSVMQSINSSAVGGESLGMISGLMGLFPLVIVAGMLMSVIISVMRVEL